ncbi:MAG TPA: hypothetical protein VJP89_14810 [Pyrinomonadaceae bacterium]|nr:hypothetical protein [Pyrinomonadaceae bacterium]
MTKHTLKFSILAAALVALSLPVVAAAQWDRGSRQDRYPDNNRGGYGRYDDREIRDSAQRLDRLAKDFERDMDRALDRSRQNGTNREDRINEEVHQFRRAAGDYKSRVGNGRDLDRSADEARRLLQEAQQVDRVARPRWFDSRLASEWSQIQRELRFISDVYGFRYDGGYGRNDDYRRDDDYRRNDRRRDDRNRNNNDWWRRIPFPQ